MESEKLSSTNRVKLAISTMLGEVRGQKEISFEKRNGLGGS